MNKELMKNQNNAGSAEILEEKKQDFVFYNASLGRRILSYLADIFISFILCVFVYEIIFFPIVRHAIGYDQSVATKYDLGQKRYSLLYDNKLLYFANEEEKFNFDSDFEYTGDLFVKFYVFKDSVGVENLIEDPIVYYYENIAEDNEKKTKEQVALMYYGDEQQHEYFEEYNSSKSEYVSLKEIYIERWKPYFDPNDTVSDEIKAEIKAFKYQCFRNYYLSAITNYTKNNADYVSYTSQIDAIQKDFDFYYQITTFASFFTVFIGLFVVCPLVDKKGRTLGKIFLKLETVNNKNFQYVQKKWRIAGILMSLLEQIPIILFIPFISVGITEIFTLSSLLIISIIGAAYCLIDLVIALANKLNYSIKELLTGTVVVDKALMDQYYREVVYGEERTTIE